ncbi:MAG: hypothetical protein E7620_00425 [Ruminococcaceae bacterium]|nr:hypothetical protein [Oscillospiraceae bacterium]
MKKTKIKKIVGIACNVLLYLFLAIAIISLVMSLISRDDSGDGTATLFGYQMRLIVSDSMGECEATDVSQYEIGSLPVRTMVFVETVPEDEAEAQEWYASLKKGDVLTFRYTYTTQVTITHRIVDIYAKESGGYMITLEGDNRDSESELMQQVIDTSASGYNYVIGKVTGSSRVLGFFTSLLREPIALVLIIIVPCAIIIVLEVIRIVGMFQSDRSRKEQEQEDEIEALRRQLAEAQSRLTNGPAPSPDQAEAPPAEESASEPEEREAAETADATTSEEAPVTEQEQHPEPSAEEPSAEEETKEEE